MDIDTGAVREAEDAVLKSRTDLILGDAVTKKVTGPNELRINIGASLDLPEMFAGLVRMVITIYLRHDDVVHKINPSLSLIR